MPSDDLSASISTVANAVNDSFVGHYYTGDQIGSARMLTSAGGWPVSSDTFYPFGQEQSGTSDPNHYKFTGKERDAESGLDYFGARYYGSTMGRFMSPDWADKPEAVPYSSLSNPQSLNLYAYVNNNPLSKIDPDGHLLSLAQYQHPGGFGSSGSQVLMANFLAASSNESEAFQNAPAQQPQGKIDISTAINHAQKAKGWFDNLKTFSGDRYGYRRSIQQRSSMGSN
jgi:RHS repeat-associated protein